RFRIELADVGLEVSGEPDVAVFIGRETVRTRSRRLRLELFHLARLWIEPSEHAGELAGPPDRAVRRRERIVRPRAEARHEPLFDRNVDASGNDDGRRPRLLGKIL